MASRAKSPQADEDALDRGVAADVEPDVESDDELLAFDGDEDEQDDPEELDDPELGDQDLDDDGLDDDEDAESGEVPQSTDGDPDADDEDADIAPIVVIPDAAFDDDEDEIAAVVVDGDDDDDDGIEGIRAGEFVCRRCYMAKRETQLADPIRMLCRDCA